MLLLMVGRRRIGESHGGGPGPSFSMQNHLQGMEGQQSGGLG